jgi:hypothetical protein
MDAIYGEEQVRVFSAFGATETRTHDMHIPTDNIPEAALREVMALECGPRPVIRGKALVVPCFFRPHVAAILSRSMPNGEA